MSADRPIDPVDRYIGQRLRIERRRRGLNQDAIARSLGLVFQQIQRYESGANRISASTLWRIARQLDVEVSDFLPPPGGAGAPANLTQDAFAGCSRLTDRYVAMPPSRRAILLKIADELAR